MSSFYRELIDETCKTVGLDADLVEAIMMVESGGNTWALRYEKGWQYQFKGAFYANLLNVTEETERELQKFSYGLMQVMGTVARELGFNEPLPMLCIPAIGIKYGCLKLKQLIMRYQDHGVDYAISAYNAGSAVTEGLEFTNQQYVNKVLQALKSVRARRDG